MKKLGWIWAVLGLLFTWLYSQSETGWISLANLNENGILTALDKETQKLDPLLLDEVANRAKADEIETQTRAFIQAEDRKWATQYEQIFTAVANAYTNKLKYDSALRFAQEDLQRLETQVSSYVKLTEDQQSIITSTAANKELILKDLQKKLETIPFYIVVFGSTEFDTRGKSLKDVEKAIFASAHAKGIEHVRGTFITSETQIAQYQVVRDRIVASVSGRVQVEGTNTSQYQKAVTGSKALGAVVGLVSVYPWTTDAGKETIPSWFNAQTVDLLVVDNSNLARIATYPANFIKETQSFLEKAKTQNLTYQNQLRSLLSEIRLRLEQDEQKILQAQEILKRYQTEQQFYRLEADKRKTEVSLAELKLQSAKSEFDKANDAYRRFLATRTIYQFQSDFALTGYAESSSQVYSNLLKSCYDRFRNNIREEFLSWVTVVDMFQLASFKESRKEIPAELEAGKILYTYVQNNLEGKPTRGVLMTLRVRFEIKDIPDYNPIMSTSQAKVNIGLTVPVNSDGKIVDQHINNGRVTRSWLGVYIEPLDEDIAIAMGLREVKGVLVNSIVSDGPAEKAGVQKDDIILKINHTEISGPAQLTDCIAGIAPETSVNIVIWHGTREITLMAILSERPAFNTIAEQSQAEENTKELGLSIKTFKDYWSEQGNVENLEGVLITKVTAHSPAERKGIKRGDVITSVNDELVKNVKEYNTVMKSLKWDDVVLLCITRKNVSFLRELRVPKQY